MKIIKLTNDITIEWNSNSNYTVIAPTNTFKDINDAIAIYPELKDAKYIAKCDFCNKYFVKYKANRRKYCIGCSDEANRINTWKRMYYIRKQRNWNNKQNRHEKINSGKLPEGWTESDFGVGERIDNNKLGTVKVFDSVPEKEDGSKDWDKEYEIIQKLRKEIF